MVQCTTGLVESEVDRSELSSTFWSYLVTLGCFCPKTTLQGWGLYRLQTGYMAQAERETSDKVLPPLAMKIYNT